MSWNDLIGRQLGQYTVVEEIGRGGSSRVYRGYDPDMQRDVAIKAIPNDAEDRVGFVRRFEREVQAVAQLNHPNIVAVYDRGETEEFVYLVMQIVSGGTLRQRLGRPLSMAEASGGIAQLALALHHAHQRGIIHRDVKPSNVLVDADNPRRLLLTDFGIAKLQGLRGLTKSGTTIGTPEYMSPEQAEGKEIDQRADVYALGCVLYEALAGRPPFIGATPVSILYQQVHSRPAYLRGFNSDVPRDLVRIVEQALAKRPEDRFGTAEALAHALQPYAEDVSSLPITARMPATSRPLRSREAANAAESPAMMDAAIPPPAVSAGEPPLAETANAPLATLTPPASSIPVPPPIPPTIPLRQPATQPPEPFQPGLGAEGLDAIFPEEPVSRSRQSGRLPHTGPNTGPTRGSTSGPMRRTFPEGMQSPERTYQRGPYDQTYHTIPLPSFRLPAKATRPLDLPLTPDGQLDLNSLMAQVEEPRFRPGGASGPAFQSGGQSFPALDPADGALAPGGGWGTAPDDDAWALERPAWVTDSETQEHPGAALRKALLETGRTRVPSPVWRPESGVVTNASRALPRSRRASNRNRYVFSALAVAALLTVSLAVWVGVSASSLGLTLGRAPVSPASTRTAAPVATATPVASPSPTAISTATPAQSALDTQAAATFRAVTLTQFSDNSCSPANNTTHFAGGQTIYVNVCTGSSVPGGPMSVFLRDSQGNTLGITSDYPIAPRASYVFYRFSVRPGSYSAVVTIDINGQAATARDIPFTVG